MIDNGEFNDFNVKTFSIFYDFLQLYDIMQVPLVLTLKIKENENGKTI